MLKNYLKITVRNLLNNKVYSLINISGLAIGLACFILISTYIKNELSYDNFHEKADRIYRPVEIQQHPGVGTQHVAVTMGPLAPALLNDFPEIENAARIWPVGTFFCRYGEKGFYEEDVVFADPAIFEIFTIPLKYGNAETALINPHSLVINEDLAHKYFGREDPTGETLIVHHSRGANDYTVTGVMQNYPENSHLNFSMLGSFVTVENQLDWLRSWDTNTLATYVLLQEGVSKSELQEKFPQFLDKNLPEGSGDDFEMYLQPLLDIHLHSGHIVYQTFNHNQGSSDNVYMFSAIALFVLLIACINFMNLSTARSAKRAKEVGIRKVLGSDRRHLICQFLGESIIITLIALLLSLGLVQLAYSSFQVIFENGIIFDYNENWTFALELMVIALIVGIVAGSYPAFFLSSYQPAQSLKGSLISGSKGSLLRKVLVLLQFSIAIALIVCTWIVKEQMDYIRNKELGFNKDQIVYVPLRNKDIREKLRLLKNELKKHSKIVNVSASSGLRGASGSQGTITVAGTNQEVEMMMRWSHVDFDFIETMQMEIVQGRDFSRAFAMDTSNSVIINETAVQEFGWDDPIGKQFEGKDGEPNDVVIGVVKDFHFYTLHQKIEPLVMYLKPARCRYLLVKVNPHDMSSTIALIEETWNKHVAGYPFEYGFLDKHFEEIYRGDENTGRLFAAFSLVAIFVACLGLFGLASFTAEQKTKEIGVRKVLGASVAGLVLLLSREFTKWVALASLIAFPVAYTVVQDWLANFVYRTEIHFHIFILSAVLVVVIALLTVSWQATKAAIANPVDSLRYE